ncbi:MAG: hypothetical protein ACRD2T_09980 [Thermoanaerobaculia bacterium]
MLVRLLAVAAGLGVTLFGDEARAGCCTVVKLDPEVATVGVRVPEPETAALCDSVIFEGDLAVGQSQNVCTVADTVL